MHYEGSIIRPPSEANSILLQISVGCSRNKCSFCGAYKNKRFKIKSFDKIMDDIFFIKNNFSFKDRLFLCDGDALIVPHSKLVNVLKKIRNKTPWINRVGAYANAKSVDLKTIEELQELRKLGLKILYFGIETGDDKTLNSIRKGVKANRLIYLCKKIKMAGIKLSVTVLLGIGGKDRSLIHARKTGKVLSKIDPDYVGALTLIIVPGTPIYQNFKNNNFVLLSPIEILNELKYMVENTNLSNGLFHANHASNYLSIRAELPKEKEKIINMLNSAILGKLTLKSESLRAL